MEDTKKTHERNFDDIKDHEDVVFISTFEQPQMDDNMEGSRRSKSIK